MIHTKMTSSERVFTTMGYKQPDRVPFFLLATMHGARELGLSIREYFSKSENVVEGQLRMQAKYRHDCLYNFFYAPLEIEAFGGEVIFYDDGPANSGRPLINDVSDIYKLEPPSIHNIECLTKVLKTTEELKANIKDEVPIIGVVMSPYSLPIMQMGFEKYIEIMFKDPKAFQVLMRINSVFCVNWANAQLAAGATAICYFDPVASSTITAKDFYEKTGFEIAKKTIASINGPTATHMASGRCLPTLNLISRTGTAAIGVSVDEDLPQLSEKCKDKLTVIGNLNGIEMRNWTPEIAENKVKEAIANAAPNYGFILSDNHGEIPWYVSEDILMAISEAVHKWGEYPLNWINEK